MTQFGEWNVALPVIGVLVALWCIALVVLGMRKVRLDMELSMNEAREDFGFALARIRSQPRHVEPIS